MDSKGMDSAQYKNERYMKMADIKGDKVMKNHGNTQKIKGDNQQYDMKRCDFLKKEMKGYNDKAYEYKY